MAKITNDSVYPVITTTTPETMALILDGGEVKKIKRKDSDNRLVVKSDTLAELKALTGLVDGQAVELLVGGRAGLFHFDNVTDYSADVAADTQEGIYVPITAGGVAVRVASEYTAQMFAIDKIADDALTNQDAQIASALAVISPANLRLDFDYRVSSVNTYIDKAYGQGALSGISVKQPRPYVGRAITKPDFFPWDSGVKPVYQADGSWGCDADPASYNTAGLAVTKTIRYVNISTGNDSTQDGTSPTVDGGGVGPYKSIIKAIADAKAVDGVTENFVIYVASGLYKRLEFWPSSTLMPVDINLSIIATGGTAVLSKEFEPQSWSIASGSIYTCTRSSVSVIWDSLNTDENGFWSKMENVGTDISDITAAGQWAVSGSTVWLWLPDDRAPDSDTRLMVAGTGAYSINLNGNLYVEGVQFAGGDAAFVMESSSAVSGEQAFNSCIFSYSLSSNGLNVEGSDACRSFSCQVFRNHRDGMNYHQNDDAVKKFNALEVNIASSYNGLSGDSNNNASTGHDGGNVQRIGGDYSHSEGPTCPDVNGCKSWNVGCIVHDSDSPADGTSYGFYAEGSGAILQADYCLVYGHIASVVVDRTSGAQFYADGWLGELKVSNI